MVTQQCKVLSWILKWRSIVALYNDTFSHTTSSRVIALDMRGYGESDKPKGISQYKIDLLAEDVKQLIDGLGKS